jgi:Zn finger protein HypA/HybF involved in hydrogenase expression
MDEEKNKTNVDDENENELCEKCGSKLATEDGMKFCPNCQGQIDFFGDDDDEK